MSSILVIKLLDHRAWISSLLSSSLFSSDKTAWYSKSQDMTSNLSNIFINCVWIQDPSFFHTIRLYFFWRIHFFIISLFWNSLTFFTLPYRDYTLFNSFSMLRLWRFSFLNFAILFAFISFWSKTKFTFTHL